MINYSWRCAVLLFLICLGLGEYYILQPLTKELTTMFAVKQKLQTVAPFKKAETFGQLKLTKITNQTWPADLAAELNALAQQFNLQINQAWSQTKTHTQVHLAILGNYAAALNFLIALANLSYPTLPYALQMTALDAKRIKIEVNLSVLPYLWQRMNNQFKQQIGTNPFCYRVRFRQSPLLLNQVPLAMLKLVGVLQMDEQRSAIIALPNGALRSLRRGEKIASEGAIIVRIDKDVIELQKASGERMQLAVSKS